MLSCNSVYLQQCDSCQFRHFLCYCFCQQTRSSQVNRSNERDIHVLLFHLLWFLIASCVPDGRNVIADSLSRQNQVLPSEWSLHAFPENSEGLGLSNDRPTCNQKEQKIAPYLPSPGQPSLGRRHSVNRPDTSSSICVSPTSIMTKELEKILVKKCLVQQVALAWPT